MTATKQKIDSLYASIRAVLVEPLNYRQGEIKERTAQMVTVVRSLKKADAAQVAEEYELKKELPRNLQIDALEAFLAMLEGEKDNKKRIEAIFQHITSETPVLFLPRLKESAKTKILGIIASSQV